MSDKFEWNDLLVAEFAGRTSWITNALDIPPALEKFKEEKTKKFEIVQQMGNTILSVKRLSDGAVFTVGDRLTGIDDKETIEGFLTNFRGNDLWVSTNLKMDYGCSLDICENPAAKPILTTVDGEEIFDEDRIVFYATRWHINSRKAKNSKGLQNVYANIENLKEWIFMNKPCLSLEDLLSVWGESGNRDRYLTAPMFLGFKKLVKEKIGEVQ